MSDQTKSRTQGAFSPLVIGALVLVGVFAFAAYFTLSAFAPELDNGRDGRAHALSQSAVGYAGMVRLLRARGDDIGIGRTIDGAERIADLVVLTPERAITPDELETASGYTTLVVLPKWAVGPHPSHPGWVARMGTFDTAGVSSVLNELSPGTTVSRTDGSMRASLKWGETALATSGEIEDLQTIAGPNIRPIITDQNGAIIMGLVEQDDALPFYVLSDPDFLNTQGVGNLDTARAGLAILDAARGEHNGIIFDVTLNGLGAARSPLRLAFDPPLLGATLALAIAAGMLGWRAAASFGAGVPVRRSIAFGKAALADNSAGLLRLGGHQRRLAPIYARLVALQVASVFPGARKDEATLDALMDTLSQTYKIEPRFGALAAEAETAKTTNQMLEAARKLHTWKVEMIRATR
ncbi:MAG: hypothetical protein NT015_12655 [Alphaproteobacteria bacterium]|nr:hypothetical protein [Alphaproteobacteria bacterium]